MIFKAIVGNPPYQKCDGGSVSSASALYPQFVMFSNSLNPTYTSMVIPARWYVTGKVASNFRPYMLNDKHITKLYDFPDCKDIFKSVDIGGGICIFLRDISRKEEGPCEIHTFINGDAKEEASTRYLKEEELDIFIRYKQLLSVVKKTLNTGNVYSSIVFSRNSYGFRTDAIVKPSKYNLPPFLDNPTLNGYRIFGLDVKHHRVIKYLPEDYCFPKQNKGLFKYKTFLAKAYTVGFGNMVSEPISGKPRDLSTETFLQLGTFDTEEEELNNRKYIKTKFFRALLGVMKQTQDIKVDTFRFIPLQDFTSNSDIDWTKSIHEIDEQLYKKYNLSKDEITFIEQNIKEMV